MKSQISNKYTINNDEKNAEKSHSGLAVRLEFAYTSRRNTSLFSLEALLIVGVGLWLSNCQHEVVRLAFCCLTVNSCVVANKRKQI
jgi:hypothetical protein